MAIKKNNNDEIQTYSHPNCYLCNSHGKILYEGLKEKLYNIPGAWNLKKCSNPKCQLVWLDPMPLESEIHKAYTKYFTHSPKRTSIHNTNGKSLLITLARRIFYVLTGVLYLRQMRAELVEMYLHGNAKGRLLDVGCGDGFRLARMRSFGWDVEGQEIDPTAVSNAVVTYGIPVHYGTLESIALPSDSFEAIIMVHVLEHVHDPKVLLKECYRLLKPGGSLVCVTPNIESYGHTYFKSSWLHLDPPRHLYLFSPQSIKSLIEKLTFKTHEIFTTPVNAESTYSGSRSIQKTGKYQFDEQLQWVKSMRKIFFQRQSLFEYKRDIMSGEEIVLKLTK